MLLEQKTTDFLEQLSSSAPIPGGGGAFGSSRSVRISFGTYGYKSDCRKKRNMRMLKKKF